MPPIWIVVGSLFPPTGTYPTLAFANVADIVGCITVLLLFHARCQPPAAEFIPILQYLEYHKAPAIVSEQPSQG